MWAVEEKKGNSIGGRRVGRVGNATWDTCYLGWGVHKDVFGDCEWACKIPMEGGIFVLPEYPQSIRNILVGIDQVW